MANTKLKLGFQLSFEQQMKPNEDYISRKIQKREKYNSKTTLEVIEHAKTVGKEIVVLFFLMHTVLNVNMWLMMKNIRDDGNSLTLTVYRFKETLVAEPKVLIYHWYLAALDRAFITLLYSSFKIFQCMHLNDMNIKFYMSYTTKHNELSCIKCW